MILREFPNLQWLKQQAEHRFAARKSWTGAALQHEGWPTVILDVATRSTYRDNIRGPLSLFTNLSGESSVKVGNKQVQIREGLFFLSNHDQQYTLEIDQPTAGQTFNIHFGEYFTDQVFQSLSHSPEKLLEKDFELPHERMEFHNRLHYRSETITRILKDLHSSADVSPLAFDEKLYALICELLSQETALTKRKQEMPVLKSSTRQELFKRLLLATDYIHACFDRDLPLEELATVSCLSKFHFLRLFKTAFGKTPHQFISEIRVQRGKELLRYTSLEVHEIARAIGFSSASSFSRMFFQQTGLYPSSFRSSLQR